MAADVERLRKALGEPASVGKWERGESLTPAERAEAVAYVRPRVDAMLADLRAFIAARKEDAALARRFGPRLTGDALDELREVLGGAHALMH